jgi:hypothetical protein
MSESELSILMLFYAAFFHEVEEFSGITIVNNYVTSFDLNEVQAIGNLRGIIWINLGE